MEVSLSVNNLKRTRELNGINSLEFETDKKIEKGNRLVFKDYQGIWNEYIVQEVEILHEGLKIEYSVFCEQSINELFGHFISDLKPRETRATAIVGKVLQDTRFSVGHIDDLGLKSFNLYHIDAKRALWKIIDIFDCDIDVSIDVKDSKVVGRYINLYKHKGSFEGKRYTHKKDIKSIKKTINYTNIVTKLYGYGKGEEIIDEDGKSTGGYGRKINFSEINGGKAYITNEDARLKYGVGKEKKHIEGIFEDGDCEDKKELLELTKKELEKRSKPQISYELKVEDLSKYSGFEFEGVGLGDDVIVKDKELNLTVYTRIIKIIDSPFDNSDTEITLGNYIKDISNKFLEYENLRKSIESRNISIGEEIYKLAKSTEQGFLKSLVDRLNTELNATGGYVYFEQGKGIIILNDPKEGNPTQAITLKGGTIAIANKKKANGDWDWTTFGTGDGFTASVLTTGILKGGKVRWNLEDGTLLIGNSPDDYNLYWDGETLNLKNTKIDFRYDKTINEIKDNLNEKISKEDILEDEEIQEVLKGQDGIPGKAGADGKTPYFHTAWANSVDGSKDFSVSQAGEKAYIGTYTDYVKEDSKDPKKYTWQLVKGKDGSTGPSGKDGSNFGWNLIKKGDTKFIGTTNYLINKYDLVEPIKEGTEVSFIVKAKGKRISNRILVCNSGGTYSAISHIERLKDNSDEDYNIYVISGNWRVVKSSNTQLYLYWGDPKDETYNPVDIEWAMLVYGLNPLLNYIPAQSEIHGEDGKDGKTGKIGQNLLRNSNIEIESSDYRVFAIPLCETPDTGEIMTFTAKIKVEKDDSIRLYNSGGMINLTDWIKLKKSDDYQIISTTFKWVDRNTNKYVQSNPPVLHAYIDSNRNNTKANKVMLEWAVLTRGDIPAIEWSPCYADVDDAISEKASEESLQDLQIHFAMYPTAEELNQNKVDLIKQQAYLDQLKTAIDSNALSLEDRLSIIEANVGAGKVSLEAINTYLHFGEEGVLIGKEGEQVRLRLINNALEITDGTKVVARFANNQTETPNLKVSGAFEFGYHVANKVDLDGDKYTVISANI